MSVEDNVSAPQGKVSPLAIAFISAALAVGILCLINTFLILRAARALDEIGAQCAYGAAREKDLPAARQSIDRVLAMHMPDEFYFRGPISSKIVFYKGKSDGPVCGPFVTVKTTLTAWIPAPQLFTCVFECLRASDMIDSFQSNSSNLIELSSMHSSPYQPSM